ncbi:hypothetical protein BJY59DRAFT_389551 [Rhodotorula toruloides]
MFVVLLRLSAVASARGRFANLRSPFASFHFPLLRIAFLRELSQGHASSFERFSTNAPRTLVCPKGAAHFSRSPSSISCCFSKWTTLPVGLAGCWKVSGAPRVGENRVSSVYSVGFSESLGNRRATAVAVC